MPAIDVAATLTIDDEQKRVVLPWFDGQVS
jgi:hypothetical protein